MLVKFIKISPFDVIKVAFLKICVRTQLKYQKYTKGKTSIKFIKTSIIKIWCNFDLPRWHQHNTMKYGVK